MKRFLALSLLASSIASNTASASLTPAQVNIPTVSQISVQVMPSVALPSIDIPQVRTTPSVETPTKKEQPPSFILSEGVRKYTTLIPIKSRGIPNGYLSQADINLMARVVMSEVGNLSMMEKVAVAESILNRAYINNYELTISNIVYSPNQFSTGDNGDVTSECYEAVSLAIKHFYFDERMVYFRTDYFHDFGTPFAIIGVWYTSLC